MWRNNGVRLMSIRIPLSSKAAYTMKRAVLLAGFVFFALATARAQIINAPSCSQTDVQNAFNSVVASTTTVNIPAGTCDWTTQVTLNVPSGSTTLSVLGAGSLTTPGGGDATVIVDNFASNNTL